MPMLALEWLRFARKDRGEYAQHDAGRARRGGRSDFGPRWMRPLARAIGWNHRSIRYWKKGERAILDGAAEKIRNLDRIGPAGVVIRRVVRKVLPKVDPWSVHRVAMAALSELVKAGLLDERTMH